MFRNIKKETKMSIGDSNSEVHAKLVIHEPKKKANEEKVIELRDGFYIAELKHPLHKEARTIVQVLKNRFLENKYFTNRSSNDGLANCYTLHALLHLEGYGYCEPMLNHFSMLDLTKCRTINNKEKHNGKANL